MNLASELITLPYLLYYNKSLLLHYEYISSASWVLRLSKLASRI